jgi:hypothetical protein
MKYSRLSPTIPHDLAVILGSVLEQTISMLRGTLQTTWPRRQPLC